jgi:hypothetical protein
MLSILLRLEDCSDPFNGHRIKSSRNGISEQSTLLILNKPMVDSIPPVYCMADIFSLLSGGGDCVINIWDLEAESFNEETKVIDTLATIPQYYP